jgi:hypothetical protein
MFYAGRIIGIPGLEIERVVRRRRIEVWVRTVFLFALNFEPTIVKSFRMTGPRQGGRSAFNRLSVLWRGYPSVELAGQFESQIYTESFPWIYYAVLSPF